MADTTEHKIEKGIPTPNKPAGRDALPFDKLDVGDSFVIHMNGHTSWGFAFAAINKAQLRHSIKLTTRLVEPGKRRVWRVG